ncbi:MAG: FAD-binding oxidoreductase [Verrucomicrobia bacterium]|nr:FAD-binding oxidoreductase [Verrucomicrobiota bacterium]
MSDAIFELRVERPAMTFQPGDCAALAAPDGTSRPYSIACGQDEASLRFVIRRMPGGIVSEWLAARQPGDVIDMSPPFGWFRPARSGGPADPSVFVATGTGIGPFLSALRSFADFSPAYTLYGVRQLADAVDVDYLASRGPFRLAVSREAVMPHHHGRVTDLLDQIPRSPDSHYYLCGLDAMIHDVSEWLEARGTPFTRIHREVFFNA